MVSPGTRFCSIVWIKQENPILSSINLQSKRWLGGEKKRKMLNKKEKVFSSSFFSQITYCNSAKVLNQKGGVLNVTN